MCWLLPHYELEVPYSLCSLRSQKSNFPLPPIFPILHEKALQIRFFASKASHVCYRNIKHEKAYQIRFLRAKRAMWKALSKLKLDSFMQVKRTTKNWRIHIRYLGERSELHWKNHIKKYVAKGAIMTWEQKQSVLLESNIFRQEISQKCQCKLKNEA